MRVPYVIWQGARGCRGACLRIGGRRRGLRRYILLRAVVLRVWAWLWLQWVSRLLGNWLAWGWDIKQFEEVKELEVDLLQCPD